MGSSQARSGSEDCGDWGGDWAKYDAAGAEGVDDEFGGYCDGGG